MNDATVNVMLRDTKTNVLRSWLAINRTRKFNMSLMNELMYWLIPGIHTPSMYLGNYANRVFELFTQAAELEYTGYREWLYGKY